MLRCRVATALLGAPLATGIRFCSTSPGKGPAEEAAAEAAKVDPDVDPQAAPGSSAEAETNADGALETVEGAEDDGKYKRVMSREFDNTLVEKYSKAALEREGRADQIESVDWCEESSGVPILAKYAPTGKNIYDHTDDIPKDVKPFLAYNPFQQREYIAMMRDRAARPLWKRLGRVAVGLCAFSAFAALVEFTRIWIQQPAEVGRMRTQILENSYGKVLELGAGHGLNIGSYPYPVHEIVMVDTNRSLLDKLHYRIPKTAYPKYSTCVDRAERLDNFKDGEFDCVVDMFGLCHYRDPVLALRQIQRVVKPTGTILLLEHGRSQYPPINWVLDYFAERHTTHTHGCLWNLPLREYFKEARLVVRELQQHHYGTTYYCIAHPEVLDEEAMKYVPKRDVMVVR